MHIDLALAAFILYLFMTINVSINAHLKSEFRLTYAKLGPTEFRMLIIIANTVLIAAPSLTTFCIALGGDSFTLLDLVAAAIIALLTVIYIATIISDARKYAKIDPPKRMK
jgi:hypothetical protein